MYLHCKQFLLDDWHETAKSPCGGPTARKPGASSLTTEGLSWRYFRAHLSAAPLKPRALPDSRCPRRDFRAHLSAAPLKLPDGWRARSSGGDFRAHLSAAPLKQK